MSLDAQLRRRGWSTTVATSGHPMDMTRRRHTLHITSRTSERRLVSRTSSRVVAGGTVATYSMFRSDPATDEYSVSLTDSERELIVRDIVASEALEGLDMPPDLVRRTLAEALSRPVADIF